MFSNYFKTAWRNLIKSKMYSSINIIGLATGMAVALLIGLWIWDELSFDNYHQNRNRIAQVIYNGYYKEQAWTNTVISMPLGNALRNQFGSDFKYVSLVAGNSEHIIGWDDKKLSGVGPWVQEDFPKMFTLVMIRGTRDGLKSPSATLISASLAKAIFGKVDPLNKTVKIDNDFNLTVAGVYEDLPRNSTFYNTKILLPWTSGQNWFNSKDPQSNWDNHCGNLYVQIADNADMNKVSAKINNIAVAHIKDYKEETFLYSLAKSHLYNEFKNAKVVGGRIRFVWLFGIIGTFVLLLACINFMNLSTARSEKRAKEVGIRKTIGSMRSQLIRQFLSESIVVSLIALVLSVIMVQLSLPFFNDLADKQMTIPWTNPIFSLLILGFAFFTGLVAGSYPAFYLSSFQPIKVLKGVFRAGRFASLPRRVLVVLQFTVSIVLIIGTAIVFRQIQYAKARPVGYTRAGLITVNMNTGDLYTHSDAIRTELLQSGAAVDMGKSNSRTTEISSGNGGFEWRGKDPNLNVGFGTIYVSQDFGHTIGWQVTQGRDFSRNFLSDSSGVILNESAAKVIGIKNPVGEIINYKGTIFANIGHRVIGVVKDMVMESPYDTTTAVMFFCCATGNTMTIRINPLMPVRAALAKIETVFKKYNPASPFVYGFTDDAYAAKFDQEERIGNLATVFAVLAIFISCLGMFGLASFVAEQRTKEIGVRKVLGASVFNLWKMLSKDFVGLVIIACLIASPLAWYFLDAWLKKYIYHTAIAWWIFAMAGIGALTITLLTVSYQAIRAALTNPVR
ncbi:MAG TPA: ABC transporter permease, partial [Puia sp.]|nr:ABC transporter permease [Puia sp.]